MYAEMITFNVEPKNRETALKMTPQFASMHESLKGYVRQTFFANKETGDFGCVSVWDNKRDLDAAMAFCIPKLQEAGKDLIHGEPTIKIFEEVTL
jgi:quinol monooxygenase YgiN